MESSDPKAAYTLPFTQGDYTFKLLETEEELIQCRESYVKAAHDAYFESCFCKCNNTDLKSFGELSYLPKHVEEKFSYICLYKGKVIGSTNCQDMGDYLVPPSGNPDSPSFTDQTLVAG